MVQWLCSTPALRAGAGSAIVDPAGTRFYSACRCLFAVKLAGKVDPLDIAPARLDTLRSPYSRRGAQRANPAILPPPGSSVVCGAARRPPASLARLSVSRGTPGFAGGRGQFGHGPVCFRLSAPLFKSLNERDASRSMRVHQPRPAATRRNTLTQRLPASGRASA